MDWEAWSNIVAPSSTDIICSWLFFFFQGFIKNKVHQVLKANITDALAIVTKEILENTWQEIEYSLDDLLETNTEMFKWTNLKKYNFLSWGKGWRKKNYISVSSVDFV